jgi:hypothetical protein
MKQHKATSFPQSASIAGMVSAVCPALSAGPERLFFAKRGKGDRIYPVDGLVLHDFWLDEGRLPFGHAPTFLGQIQKNHISTGTLAGYPQAVHVRLLARLARLLPGYQLAFFNQASTLGLDPVHNEIDITQSAFVHSLQLLPVGERPPRIRINGVLGLTVIATDGSQTGLAPATYWPDSVTTARALGLLRRMQGPHAPWRECQELADRFVAQAGSQVGERYGTSLRIAVDEARRAALLDAGFYIGTSGWVYFCTEHDRRTVDRLARLVIENLCKEA